MPSRTYAVDGMACGGCETNVEDAIDALDGVTRVEADHGAGVVEVDADDAVSDDEIAAAIDEAGYELAD